MMTVTWLRERVESGMTISQAIALLRSLEPIRRRGRSRRSRPVEPPLQPGPVVASPATIDRFSLDSLGATLLLQFGNLDEYSAHRTVMQALAVYTVEDICLRLFSPVLVEIGHRWERGELDTTVEHFAAALIRALLDGLFRSAATSDSGPLTLVGCAPGELHELGALMLALFLRRAGVRVAYLGQNVEAEGLLAMVANLRPVCVLLSAARGSGAAALAALADRFKAANIQTALYVGGQAYDGNPLAVEQVRGHYLGSDVCAAIDEMKKRLFP
jgi:methanogenic corrinoid protein MtbC1